jgi:uncharacterized protein YqfB (UPF0267 family)
MGVMKIISFAKTTAALLAGHKTVTRRYWKPSHAAMFKRGDIVQAWDKSPRYGGKKVAEIKIITVYQEDKINAPDDDYEKEGFKYMCDAGIKIDNSWGLPTPTYWYAWKLENREEFKTVWVIRFELLQIINKDE